MFRVFIGRTSNTISALLNHKYNCVKIRLYKRSYFKNLINREWDKNTLDIYQRYPKRYKHFISCRKYSTEIHKIEENDMFPIKHVFEHKFIHSILENSIHYRDTTMQPFKIQIKVSYEEICKLYTTDWSQASVSCIYDAIKNMAHSYLNGTRFETVLYDSILQACTNQLLHLQNRELKTLMQHLIVLVDESKKSYYWQPFLKTLNKDCLNRFYPSTVDQMLLICDAFYQLLDNNSYYMWRVLRKLATQPNRLTAKNLVQLFFFLNFSKLSTSTINLFDIELRIQECLYDLSVNEIGILARGFFMIRRRFKNQDLTKQIIIKVKENIQFIHSVTLASVMKQLRYTNCSKTVFYFEELMKSLNTEIPRLSLKCLTHIAHAFGGLRVYNEQLTRNILERIKNEITTARLKDIERILFAIFSVAPYNDYYQETCQILLNEILSNYQTNRSTEIDKYPLSLVRIVTHITGRNIYVPELIQYVLDPKNIQKTYRNNIHHITTDTFVLNCSVKIEFPDYKGPFMTNKIYDYIVKKCLPYDHIHGDVAKLRTEIIFTCKRNLGINACVDRILPHTSKDLVLGFDEDNNPVEVEPILSSMPTGSIKYVNTENLKNIRWKVLYPITVQQKVIGHQNYIGPVYRKIKQLKTIGYTPLVIDEVQWNSFTEEKDKENYLKELIYNQHPF